MRPMRPGNFWSLVGNVILVVLFIAGIGYGVTTFDSWKRPVGENALIQGLWQKTAKLDWKNVLNAGLPVMKQVETTSNQAAPGTLTMDSGSTLPGRFLFYLTRVKIDNPINLLQQEIPLLAAVMPVTTADSVEEWTEPEEITEPPASNLAGGKDLPMVDNSVYSTDQLIAVYNTHSSETYELTDGLTHIKGKAGGVATVTAELAKALEETYRIRVVRSDKIHDTSFNKSYVESEKTVKALVRDNPKLKMLIDVHRDGLLPRERTLVKLGGQEMARVLLVVGTDARAAHPNWRKNLEFARLVAAKMDKLYPGLSRGVSIKDGRYNQQYHAGGLLVELGSVKNSTDEAVRSAKLFANVLVAVLNDLQ